MQSSFCLLLCTIGAFVQALSSATESGYATQVSRILGDIFQVNVLSSAEEKKDVVGLFQSKSSTESQII
jgi:hypothetical protein